MLKPSMNELMAKVNNRYLLVNLAAQRARDLAEASEENGVKLPDKAVKLALDEIADGSIVYRDGPRVEPEPEPEPEPQDEEVLDLDAEEEAPAEEKEDKRAIGNPAPGTLHEAFMAALERSLAEGR